MKNVKFKFEKSKSTIKTNLDLSFFKVGVVYIVISAIEKLFTNQDFLNFVVEIVKLILNRSFYYLKNNRFFICWRSMNGIR